MFRARERLKIELDAFQDQLWGIALGVRVRWDRLLRRSRGAGLEARAEAGITAVSAVGVSLATAAVVAVIGVLGGSGQHPILGTHQGNAAVVGENLATQSSLAEVAPAFPATSSVSRDAASDSSGGATYKLGPTETTHSDDRVDQTVTIPDPI